MTLRGYTDQKKSQPPQYATVTPIRVQQNGLDVLAHVYARLVGTDAVEADSSTTQIIATAHAALRGDIIQFTSGDLDGYEIRVASTDDDEINLAETLPAAPSAADTFRILRQVTPLASEDGEVSVSVTAVSSSDGRTHIDNFRQVFTSDTLEEATWTEVFSAAEVTDDINALLIFNSSGEVLELATGAAASESRVLLIPPGGFEGPVPLRIPSGTRVAVKAIDGDVTVGQLLITALG